MDPITMGLILGFLGEAAAGVAVGAAAGLVISALIITLDMVIDWFKQRAKLVQADRHKVGFTLAEKVSSGEYTVVQGIFDTKTNEIVDSRTMKSKDLDSDLKKKHNGEALVIYT